jgi:ribonuclease R
MQQHLGEEFDGVISGITNYGVYVELPNTVEGMVSIRLMDNDYYVFHEDKYELVGERTGKVYRLGDKVHIAVMNTDKLTRTIDFRFVKPMEEAWE